MATSLWSRAPGQNRAVPTHDSTLRKPPLRTAFLEFPQGLACHARFWADCRPYGSNRQKRCPKSSATFIGLRSRTLAAIAERISLSHPALTVPGATRLEHHCGTCGDCDANDYSV